MRFDKLSDQCKRTYQMKQQEKLQDDLENLDNHRNFRTKIGKLGIVNDQRTSISREIKDDYGQISSDRNGLQRKL